MKKLTSLKDTYTLNNGREIPALGFGTWQSKDGEEAYNAVYAALDCGYVHIDTATAYSNEESVGRAVNDYLKKSGRKREELFITTKLQNPDHGYERTKKAIEKSLALLGLDYIDLYLIHWPNPIMYRDNWKEMNAESWRAMEEAVRDGKILSLGLSNFRSHHIDALIENAGIMPVINQIKFCPSINQRETAEYSRKKNMLLEAYSPLGTGAVLSDSVMKEIADKYNKSTAQVAIRYSLQSGYIPLPKSVNKDRIRDNADVYDFELSEEDISRIASLKIESLNPPRDPDATPF